MDLYAKLNTEKNHIAESFEFFIFHFKHYMSLVEKYTKYNILHILFQMLLFSGIINTCMYF